MSGAGLPPISLYVHLPWCARKCPYCDFNSYRAADVLPEQQYVDALLRDLDADLQYLAGRCVASVFIGGGTPSLFSGATIMQLMTGIRHALPLAPDAEITLEANPGAAEVARFAVFRAAGVNRLSIGVQSFRDAMLRRLGRVHDSLQAVAAIEGASAAGFENINLDLMYGLPNDDVRGSLADLARAVDLSPAHISWYQLTLEPNTAFHRAPPPLPNEDTIAEIELLGRRMLATRGYERYEVSAYAPGGWRCAHNVNYWAFGDYIGIGAGAHGKMTLVDGTIRRTSKPRNPRTYVEHIVDASSVGVECVESTAQIVLEYLMNGLRLVEGTGVEAFEQRTGQSRDTIRASLVEARRRQWMVNDPERLAATPRGFERLNSLLMLFC